MKTYCKSVISLAVSTAFVMSAHAGNNPADDAAAFQQYHDAAMAFNDLPAGTPDNQLADQFKAAVAGLERLGIPADQQPDLIGNVHNLATLSDLNHWIGADLATTISPVKNDVNTVTKADQAALDKAQRFENFKGEHRVLDNIQRTNGQVSALVASQDQEHGRELVNANQLRTASQQVDANQAAIARANQVRLASDQELAKRIASNKTEIAQNQSDIVNLANINDSQDHVLDSHADRIAATEARVTGDELAQANRVRTAEQHVQATSETETSIRGVRSEQAVQGEFIQREAVAIDQNSAAITSNAQRIENNSQRIDRNAKRIDETREDLKKGLNNAAAMTGLHYHSNDAYAISAGTSNGEGAALAGGLSHGFTPHTAATVQASTSMDGGYMASVGFSGDF